MANQGQRQIAATSWPARLGLIAIGVLLTVAVIVYSTFYFGLIQGEEFSPQTFKRRLFAYYEIPLVGLQVSPITRTDKTGKLEDFLVKQKIVAVKKGNADRWDLVIARRGNLVSSFGDAQILCNYFDSVDAADKEVWLSWTEQHLELGKLLWPVVAELARQELYILVPHLLHLAGQASTPRQFKGALDRTLTTEYVNLAQNQQTLGQHEQAIELYTHALDRLPEQVDALQGRAQSLKSIGKTKDAAADLSRVREIQDRS